MKYCRKIINEMAAFVEENGLMAYGGTMVKDFCAEFDITEETFHQWMKKSEFSEIIENAKQKYKANLERRLVISLSKSATGYEVEDIQTKLIPDEEGNPTIREQVKTKKHVPPNVAAGIFILNNLDPETWQNRQRQDVALRKEEKTEMSREDLLKELARLEEIEKMEDKEPDGKQG